ncbi:MAG: hypothetical protein BMS9Abin02_0628 [Anaerolineae bacterium]|nr:MAG: hypothetical protein BMS9Abin02_0628 [Anaerolineae bacterium]
MAKKVRRVRRKRRADQPSTKNQSEDVARDGKVDANSINSRSGKEKTKNRVKLTPEEKLREEYAYVIFDLRRIAILAAALFVLLILLNILLK